MSFSFHSLFFSSSFLFLSIPSFCFHSLFISVHRYYFVKFLPFHLSNLINPSMLFYLIFSSQSISVILGAVICRASYFDDGQVSVSNRKKVGPRENAMGEVSLLRRRYYEIILFGSFCSDNYYQFISFHFMTIK